MIEKRGILFGFLAGLYPIFLGASLFIDGLQTHSGLTITSSGGVQVVEKVFTTSVPSFSSYGMLMGIPFVFIGFYICYLASTKEK